MKWKVIFKDWKKIYLILKKTKIQFKIIKNKLNIKNKINHWILMILVASNQIYKNLIRPIIYNK